MFYCPHCGGEVDEAATSCPHCGSDDETGWSETQYLSFLPPEEDVDLGPDASPAEPRASGARLVVLPLLLVLAGLTFLLQIELVALCLLILFLGAGLQVLLDALGGRRSAGPD